MILMGTERKFKDKIGGAGGRPQGYSNCSLELKLLHKVFGEIAYYDLFLLFATIHMWTLM